mgnify:CR=1 FL=1
MINVGLEFRPPEITKRFATFQSFAFKMPFKDNSVESVFCIRLMHHVDKHEDRIKLLAELGRIASDKVIVSLWIDENLEACKRDAA